MKPMITLIALGITILGTTFIIAQYNFDGVVEEKTYEAALKYDETAANINSMDKAIKNIKAEKYNNGIYVSFAFDPSDTVFYNAKVQDVRLVRPGSRNDYHLEKYENGYRFSGEITSGWYNLQIICSSGQTNITITRSLYIG